MGDGAQGGTIGGSRPRVKVDEQQGAHKRVQHEEGAREPAGGGVVAAQVRGEPVHGRA
jgi:hypothetical protein